MTLTKERKQELIGRFGDSEQDTGSTAAERRGPGSNSTMSDKELSDWSLSDEPQQTEEQSCPCQGFCSCEDTEEIPVKVLKALIRRTR